MLKQIAIDEITRVIGLATAPAFLLGAVAALLTVLLSRMDRLLEARQTDRPAPASVAGRRLKLLRAGITANVYCGPSTGCMIVMVFVEALFGSNYSTWIILTFILAVNLFMASLFLLWLEIRLASR